jgi:teichoic acid glycerol-phosphate primase
MADKKGVALNPNTYVQLTDHLAPLACVLNIPLLLTDADHAKLVQSVYPEIQVLLLDWQEVNPDYLASEFDILFQSEMWNRNRFYAMMKPFEEKYGKVIRNVHCPHGFSDKIFWFKHCVWEDITLVYGKNMLDMLEEQGLLPQLNAYIHCGNYRYSYYQRHRSFYDSFMQREVFDRFDQEGPVILYAPTCKDEEETTSFFDSHFIFDLLPPDYNLIVKVHPYLEKTDPSRLYQMMGKYERKNVLFIKDLPLIYPLLARSSIYIGDMSSIGYDFLAFNRPMFFLNHTNRNPQTDRNLFLYRCGIEIKRYEYEQLYSIMATSLPSDQERFFSIRKQIYDYTFGEDVLPEVLKASIQQAYLSPKKE